MFSFAMTSGLASVFDKFKILITLRRAQKFGDTGPCKNFDFLPLGEQASLRSLGLLRPGPRGPKVLRYQMVL